jgi:hypothetical protein
MVNPGGLPLQITTALTAPALLAPAVSVDPLRLVLLVTALISFAAAIALFVHGARSGDHSSEATPKPDRKPKAPPASDARTDPAPAPAAPVDASEEETPPPARTPDAVEDTETDFPFKKPSKPAPPPPKPPVPKAADALALEAQENWEGAAALWRARGDFPNELRVLERSENLARIAELELAFARPKRAIGPMRRLLSDAPTDEALRLRLIEALVDTGNHEEAQWLTNVLLEADAPFKPKPEFFASAGRVFEAARDFKQALTLYKASIRFGCDHSLLPTRILYLEHLLRLKKDPASGEGDDDPVKFLERAFDDTHFANLGTAAPADEKRNPRHHEIVLGHHCFGRARNEPRMSVRSPISLAARFEVMRLVKNGPLSVTFEGKDRFLDSPVMIKLKRHPLPPTEQDLLRARFAAMVTIAHPNVSRPTYIDRFGDVYRVVSDYHGNGTLRSMLEGLDRVGLPLVIRLLLQVTAGVCAAHRHGVIHGDLRPENILIGHDNLVKIVDFALEPWPVRKMAPDETPRVGNPGGLLDSELQTDIGMFADLVDFATTTIRVAPITGTFEGPDEDPVADLREISRQCRDGEFDSILHVHRALGKLLERSLPGQRDPMQTA